MDFGENHTEEMDSRKFLNGSAGADHVRGVS